MHEVVYAEMFYVTQPPMHLISSGLLSVQNNFNVIDHVKFFKEWARSVSKEDGCSAKTSLKLWVGVCDKIGIYVVHYCTWK